MPWGFFIPAPQAEARHIQMLGDCMTSRGAAQSLAAKLAAKPGENSEVDDLEDHHMT